MKGLLADLKHALRLYWRTPASSLIAVVVLAVGMAFVGAFLSLYADLALRPNPGIEDSRHIVTIGQIDGTRFTGIPIALIERMAEEMSSLEAVVGVEATSMPVGPDADNTMFEIVTNGFFDGIRPKLAMGRGFEALDHEEDAEPVVVISDRYWREELDADPGVLGTTIEVARRETNPNQDEDAEGASTEFRIVGVMSPQMRGIMFDDVQLWAPFETFIPVMMAGAEMAQLRAQLGMRSLGRVSRGASADSVAGELVARYPETTEEYRLQPGFRLDAVAGLVRNIGVHRDTKRQLQLFLGGSILLALVAAANVSLFLLARAPGRRRELAIRMSVGAPLKRLARQLATESGLLVVVAGALGLMTSFWLVNFLRGLAFLRQAQWRDVTLLDWRVLSLVGIFLLVLTLLVSLAPILGLKRLGIASSSRTIAARASLAQQIAGTVQVAIAGTLGGAAIAFGWFLASMTLGYPGYETEDRVYVQFSPFFIDASGQGRTIAFQTAAVDAARQREIIEAIPGVRAFSLSAMAPASQTQVSTFQLPDPNNPAEQVSVGYISIDDQYVDVLGLRLRYGRAPEKGESAVALVNQALARRFFGREDVVGESIAMNSRDGERTGIVGVLEDLSFLHPAADVEPILFMNVPTQTYFGGPRGIIETALPAAELQQELQRLIDSGELELGGPSVRPLADLRDNLIAPDKARSGLTIGTAVLVVLLAAFGFYGTLRYLVSAGRREYAIRASLGAGPKALGRLVFMRGLLLSLPGLVLGAMLAFILVAWLRDDFISRDISPGAVTVAVVFGLTLLLLAASLGPARQARRTQPAPLLKEE